MRQTLQPGHRLRIALTSEQTAISYVTNPNQSHKLQTLGMQYGLTLRLGIKMLIFYLLNFFFSPGGVAEAPRGAVREGTSDRSRQGEFEGWIL